MSRLEKFKEGIGCSGFSSPEKVLSEIPDYRLQQEEHLKLLAGQYEPGSKHFVAVVEALKKVEKIEQEAKERLGI